MNDKKKIAVIYCRVSSDKQVREGHGLESQENRCRNYAAFNNFQVETVFRDEGISGAIFDRPGINNLLDQLEKTKEKRIVIVDDINRIARDVVVHFTIKKAIEKAGGELISLSMKLDDSPEGNFIETIMAASAELERNRNSRQVNDRMRSRLESGYWPFPAPLGYKFQKVDGHKKLIVPDEQTAPIIKEALEGFASSRFLTKTDVQKFLKDKKINEARGRDRVYLEQVKRILTQKLYTGKIEFLKWKITERDGHHQAIIPYSTYLKVQERLNSKVKGFSNYNLSTDFPLRGFIVCPECNKKYTAGWSVSGNKTKHPYYVCNTKGCKQKYIRRDHIHEQFHNLLISLKPNVDIQGLLKKIVKEQYDLRFKSFTKLKIKNKSRIQKLDAEMKQLTTTLVKLTNNAMIKRIESDFEALERKKSNLELQNKSSIMSLPDFGTAFDKVFQFILDIDKAWVEGDLKQKKMVQYLVYPKNLPFTKQGGFGTAPKSLLFELSGQLSIKKSCRVEVVGI